MGIAFLSAMRSKDPCTQVGACIVNDEKKIVGIGYNGMPKGCSDDEFPWDKNTPDPLDSKYLYGNHYLYSEYTFDFCFVSVSICNSNLCLLLVCHAEVNAILNKNSQDVQGCTLYVGMFPCNECAKVIIQSGIKSIIYMSDKNCKKIEAIASRRMLDAARITYRY